MAIEIGRFPSKNGDFPVCYVAVYQRVSSEFPDFAPRFLFKGLENPDVVPAPGL